jgi:hypothetical protein
MLACESYDLQVPHPCLGFHQAVHLHEAAVRVP